MIDIQSMIVRLTGDGTSYARMISDAVEQTKHATAQIEHYCTVIATALTAALGGIGSLSMGEFAKFDKGITESIAKMGGVAPEVRKQMEAIAKNLSVSGKVVFTPTELAKAYEAMAGGGLNAVQSMKMLEIAAVAAQSGMMDMEETTKSLMGALYSFGGASKNTDEFAANMKRLSDVVVTADNATITSSKYLLKAIAGDGGRAAKEWGMSLEELVGSLSVYAQKGVEAADASNLLGRAIRLVPSAFIKNEALWKRENINLMDETTGRWLHFSEALDKLAASTKNLDDPEYLKFIKALGLKDLSRKAILPFLSSSGMAKGFTETYKTGADDRSAEKAKLQMQSFTNQLGVLRNELLVLAIDIGKVLAPGIAAVADQVRELTGWFRNMSNESKKSLVMTGVYVFGAAASFLVLIAAVKIAGIAFGFLTGLLGLLPVALVLNVAAWITYKAVLMAAVAATVVYKGLMLIVNALVLVATGEHGIFTLAILAEAAALTFLASTLTITNTLLAAGAVVAATAAAVVFVGVLAGLAAAAYAAYKAVQTFLSSFLSTGNWAGPIAHIGDLFREWGTILTDVFAIAQVNMNQAWKVLEAGAKLAIIQVKLLWPPLWQRIVDSAGIAAELMGLAFRKAFWDALNYMAAAFKLLLITFSPAVAEFFSSGEDAAGDFAEEANKKLKKQVEESEALKERLKSFDVPTSEEEKAAREEVARQVKIGVDMIAAEKEKQKKLLELQEDQENERNKAEERGRGKKNLPGKHHTEIKIDQALFGSQEAFRRLEHQADMINELFEGHGPKEDPKVEAAKKVTDELEKQVVTLRDIDSYYSSILGYMEDIVQEDIDLMEGGMAPRIPGVDINKDPLNPRNSSGTEIATILGEMRDYLKKMSESPTIEVEEAAA